MRRYTLPFALLALALTLSAQETNKKRDLTGVWQGGSNRIGTWEEANGGGGTNATTGQVTPFAVRGAPEKAPYQPWAAEKVLESFNRRGIDDPMALCLPSGIPRIVTLGLFPQEIIQTPQQVVMLYEYM